jgi:hypothetical protein
MQRGYFNLLFSSLTTSVISFLFEEAKKNAVSPRLISLDEKNTRQERKISQTELLNPHKVISTPKQIFSLMTGKQLKDRRPEELKSLKNREGLCHGLMGAWFIAGLLNAEEDFFEVYESLRKLNIPQLTEKQKMWLKLIVKIQGEISDEGNVDKEHLLNLNKCVIHFKKGKVVYFKVSESKELNKAIITATFFAVQSPGKLIGFQIGDSQKSHIIGIRVRNVNEKKWIEYFDSNHKYFRCGVNDFSYAVSSLAILIAAKYRGYLIKGADIYIREYFATVIPANRFIKLAQPLFSLNSRFFNYKLDAEEFNSIIKKSEKFSGIKSDRRYTL